MAKFMDKVYRGASWLIMGVSLLGYFAFMILSFDGTIEQTLNDWRSWLHIAFVIYLNITMVSSSLDSAIQKGIISVEFSLADELNNDIIESVNNEMESFRDYTRKLNEHELISIREDYLFKVGDKKVGELTKNETRAYKRLKPIKHNIYGFNLPLYYEISKNGEVNYKASVEVKKGRFARYGSKIVFGVMFGLMTINVAFQVGNVGSAFVSVLIIGTGLIGTFITTYFPKLFEYKVAIPKKVILKKTFYNGFIKFKNGTHKLKELDEKDIEVVVDSGVNTSDDNIEQSTEKNDI